MPRPGSAKGHEMDKFENSVILYIITNQDNENKILMEYWPLRYAIVPRIGTLNPSVQVLIST